jgi:Spy/CpxP family protein refolding chaperone
MRLSRFTPLVAAAALFAACDHGPTEPTLAAQLDLVDPYVLTFNASDGLPGAPFHRPGPGSRPDARGPGAPFPDSLKLTEAQRAAIQALRDAFDAAHKADLDALKAIHEQARAAVKAGKARSEVRAILETARPVLERLHSAFEALHTAIYALLTPEQKAWIAAHKPAGPPPEGP